MTRVFTDKEFDGFEREQIKLSHFVTMTEYDPTFDVIGVAVVGGNQCKEGRAGDCGTVLEFELFY